MRDLAAMVIAVAFTGLAAYSVGSLPLGACTKSVRISAAIEVFAMMSDSIQDFARNTFLSLQEIVSCHGVHFDNSALPVIQPARLVKYSQWDVCFTDVMKHGGRVQPLKIGFLQTQAQPKVDGYPGDEEAVLIGPLVVAPHGREPFSEAALRDAIGDFSPSFFRPDHIYRLAQGHCSKH